MIEKIPLTVIFVKMGVVIGIVEPVITRIGKIMVMIFPAVRVERCLAGHITHRAYRRYLPSCGPVTTVFPIGIICIHIRPVYIVQLIGLKVMRSLYFLNLAVNACHIGSEPHDTAVSGAYREPSYPVRVNHGSGVKRHLAIAEARRVGIDKTLFKRACPRPYRRRGR